MYINRYLEKIEESKSISLMQRAAELQEKGQAIINLTGGEPDFDTPSVIVEEAVKRLKEGDTHYLVGRGLLELREKIAECEKRLNNIECTSENVIMIPGGKFGVYMSVASLINAGDEVVILAPMWVSYAPIVKACGGVPVISRLDENNNYQITEQKLEKCLSDKTKMIIINYPNNPSGRILTKEEANILFAIMQKYQVYLLSDEVYNRIVFDDRKSISMASYKEVFDRVITVNGFSKSVAMTGWRIGYVIAEKTVTDIMFKLYAHTITGLSPFIQKAALKAFDCEKDIEEMRRIYEERRNYFITELNKIQGISCTVPEGAFYAWVKMCLPDMKKSIEEELLERTGILGVPGKAYGIKENNYMRFSFACNIDTLKDAVIRLQSLK